VEAMRLRLWAEIAGNIVRIEQAGGLEGRSSGWDAPQLWRGATASVVFGDDVGWRRSPMPDLGVWLIDDFGRGDLA